MPLLNKYGLFMKKILVITAFIALFFASTFLIAEAATTKPYDFNKDSGISELGAKTELSAGGVSSPEEYIGIFLTLLFSFLGIIFFILTIYAGINWMTAQGDAAQVTKAKETLIRAIVGLVIALAAYGITYFVMNMFNPASNTSVTHTNTTQTVIIDGQPVTTTYIDGKAVTTTP